MAIIKCGHANQFRTMGGYFCPNCQTFAPDDLDKVIKAKLALFDRMREVLREVQRAYPAEDNIGLIALDYQMKHVYKVLAEANALAEPEAVGP